MNIKLTNDQKAEIKRRFEAGESIRDISKDYPVAEKTIRRAVKCPANVQMSNSNVRPDISTSKPVADFVVNHKMSDISNVQPDLTAPEYDAIDDLLDAVRAMKQAGETEDYIVDSFVVPWLADFQRKRMPESDQPEPDQPEPEKIRSTRAPAHDMIGILNEYRETGCITQDDGTLVEISNKGDQQ